jgi:hypothetical protein
MHKVKGKIFMKLTNNIQSKQEGTVFVNMITTEEVEMLLSTELGVRKAEYDPASWQEIMDFCKARITWHVKRTNMVDLLEEAMNDYYKKTPFFIMDKGRE